LEDEMSDWQPIETAPKDGTEILVYDVWQKKGELFIVGWHFRDNSWRTVPGEWRKEPTHWIRLPPPPAEQERPDA